MNSLRNHLKMHTKIKDNTEVKVNKIPEKKKFTCDICSQIYTCPKAFKRHVRRHFGEDLLEPLETRQRYQCCICKKKLTTKQVTIKHLVNHYRTTRVYKWPKKYQCEKCLQRYMCPKSFKRHVCPKDFSGNAVERKLDENSRKKSKVFAKTSKPSTVKEATQFLHNKAPLASPSPRDMSMAPCDNPAMISPDVTSSRSTEVENRQETCVETDITSIHVDIDPAISLKPQSIKQEPVEIHEVDRMLEMTNDDQIDSEHNVSGSDSENITKREYGYHLKNEHGSESVMDERADQGSVGIKGEPQSEYTSQSATDMDVSIHDQASLTLDSLTCDSCSRDFANKSALTKHIKNSHPELYRNSAQLPSHRCRICNKTFEKPSKLARHQATHKMEGLIKTENEEVTQWGCQICSRYFTNNVALTNHVRMTHPDVYKKMEKPKYICPYCGKECVSPSKLARHKATHKQAVDSTGNQIEGALLWCEVCAKPCATKTNYTNHVWDEHSDHSDLSSLGGTWADNVWTCNGRTHRSGLKCTKQFANRSGLVIHIRVSHPDLFKTLKTLIYKCKHCLRVFEKPNLLAKHAANHRNTEIQGSQESGPPQAGDGEVQDGAQVENPTQHRVNKHSAETGGVPQTGVSLKCDIEGSAEAGLKSEVSKNGMETCSESQVPKMPQCEICDMHFLDMIEKSEHIQTVHALQSAFNVKSEPIIVDNTEKVSEPELSVTDTYKPSVESKEYDTEYTCEICQASFNNSQEKRKHFRRTHRYKCQHCDRHFSNSKSLQKHRATHDQDPNSEKGWTCVCCEQQFLTRPELTNHIIDEHTDKNSVDTNDHDDKQTDLPCPECSRCFGNKAALTNHLRIEHPKQFKSLKKASYKCKFCSKHYDKPSKLAVHAATHTGTPCWDCPGCEQDFASRDDLTSHIRQVHAEQNTDNPSDTRLKCCFCDMVTDRPIRLAQHTTTHTGFQKYHCTESDCDYKTHDKTLLLGHVRKQHTHELPFQCQDCGLQFELKERLNKHMRRKHPNSLSPVKKRPGQLRQKPVEKPKVPCKNKGIYTCHECGKIYFYNFALHEHIRSVHLGIRYPCSMCPKNFASKSIRRDHVKAAHSDATPYRCGRCGERFALRNQLRKHLNRVRKCAPILNASIGQEGMETSEQQLTSSVAQQARDSIGQQASDIIAGQDNKSIKRLTYPFLAQQAYDLIGQQVINSIYQQPTNLLIGQKLDASIDQQQKESIGQERNHSIGQEINDSIGQESNDSIGQVQKPKIFPCDLCSKSFTSKQGLHFHRQGQHLGERKYKCSYSGCEKAFTKMNVLREHERLHSDVYEFSCKICGKQFKQRGCYYAHTRRKTGCGQSVNQTST